MFRSLHSLQQERHIRQEHCILQLVDCIEQMNGNHLVQRNFLPYLSRPRPYLDHCFGEVDRNYFAANCKECKHSEECQIEWVVVEGEADSRMVVGLMPC